MLSLVGDISPEELFNMFFGGGFPSGKSYIVNGQNNAKCTDKNNYIQISLYLLLRSSIQVYGIAPFQKKSEAVVMTPASALVKPIVKIHFIVVHNQN